MNIRKEKIWLDSENLLEVVEVWDKDEVKNYGYTYMVKVNDVFTPVARWDNIAFTPRVGQYDVHGRLVRRQKDRGKTLRQVMHLIRIFGPDLRQIDLANIF